MGRIPVLVPIRWEEDYPVFGVDGIVPADFETVSTRPGYEYLPLVQSDDFMGGFSVDGEVKASGSMTKQYDYDSFGLKSCWQINHEPDLSLIKRDFETGTVEITTDKLCKNVTQAKTTQTQRMRFPGCVGEVGRRLCRYVCITGMLRSCGCHKEERKIVCSNEEPPGG